MRTIEEKIISQATFYVGQKETTANKSFIDEQFLAKMLARGWFSGLAWCAFFAELVWVEAYRKMNDEQYVKALEKLFSGSALKTFNNFKASNPSLVSEQPSLGALVVWQFGNTASGHIGIVVAIDEKRKRFQSIEGNTNADGGREGNIVASKSRLISYKKTTGLNLKGFIKPL